MGVLGGRLRGRVASLDIFGPIADVLLGIEDQVGGTGHVVLPLALAHVVVGAVGPILVVADVSVLLGAGHVMSWVGWDIGCYYMITWLVLASHLRSLVV